MPELTKHFVFVRDTKNFSVYVEKGNEMNKLYLPHHLPNNLTITIKESEQ